MSPETKQPVESTPERETPSPDKSETDTVETTATSSTTQEAQALRPEHVDAAPAENAAPSETQTTATPEPEIPPVMVVPCEMPPDAADVEENTQQAAAAPKPVQALAGPLEKAFRGLSSIAPIALLLLVVAHVWPDFWYTWQGSALYCPGEIKGITLFQQTQASGQWLAPIAGDAMGWPLFTAWLGLLSAALPQDFQTLLYPLGGALAGLLAICGVWTLARAAGFGRQAAFAAALLLLVSALLMPLLHQVSPAALSAALMLFSLSCLCRGWQAERSWLLLPAGFVLAGLAGLCGGLFPLLLPLLTSFFFLIWRCTYGRAQRSDALYGFVLLLVLLGGWLGLVILLSDAQDYLSALMTILFQQPWPLPSRWWLLPLVAGIAIMPWLCLPVFVSWGRVLLTSVSTLRSSRHQEAGSAFVWLALILGLGLTFCIPQSQVFTVATALGCVAAPLLGKALLRLSPLGSRFFYLVVALLLLHAGMAMTAAGFSTSLEWMNKAFTLGLSDELRNAILSLKSLPVIGGGCILLAVLLARLVRRDLPGGALLACVLGIALLAQPVMLMLVPELGAQPMCKLSRLQKDAPAAKPEPAAVPAPEVAPAPVPAAEPAATPESPAELPAPQPAAQPEGPSVQPAEQPAEQPTEQPAAQEPAPVSEQAAEPAPEQPAPQAAEEAQAEQTPADDTPDVSPAQI